LIPLLYSLINTVEAQQAQLADTEADDGRRGWVNGVDVYQALAFRGEEPPGRVLEEYVGEQVVGGNMRRRLRVRVDPPGELGWGQMELVGPPPEKTWNEENEGVELEEVEESDRESTLTDEEDIKLDELLNELDTAYDGVLEEGLWNEKEKAEEGDWTCDLLWRDVGDDQKRVIAARQGE
jgi:hypothetical protein